MFQQLLIFSFIGQLADSSAMCTQKDISMNRMLSCVRPPTPTNHSVIGVLSIFLNFTWKITGEIEKEIAWY